MSLLAFVVVAFGFAGLAIVVRLRVRAVTVVGLLGLAAAVVAAVAIDPAQVVRDRRDRRGHDRRTCGCSSSSAR